MGKTARGEEHVEGELTGKIIGTAICVLHDLRSGSELAKQGLCPEQQKALSVRHDGKLIEDLIASEVVIDTKLVVSFRPDHVAQMLDYLNVTGLSLGLLLNFRYRQLRIKRVILGGSRELEYLVR